MPVINGVYLKDFPALPSSVADANIIPIAITGDNIAYRTTVAGIVTDARVTSKLLTGLSVTGSTILATDTILQAFGKVQNQLNGKVSSVGLTMPAAFNVANSPITSAGTLAVTAAGVASQYIRGDGALADFPTTGGGGSSVSYYLNGSVSQGTIGGNAYYEMNKTPVIGTGTDFSIGADGYIAQFITDANDPASLLIPGGNWNVEMYFSASSSGGTPSFYVEVYKYDGSTFTLLGSSATTPEGITNGTAIDIYYTSVGIPETVLTITDRLAIRVYVTHSGRTITLHTEDNHLSEIVTTFSNGLTALNGLTKQTQYFAVGSTGTDFNISSSVDTHTFNIPSASATARGVITTGTQTIAGAKTFNDNLTVSFGASTVAAIQATTTNAGGRALSCLADSTLEPFTVKQLGSGSLATFFRQIAGTPDDRVNIYNDGSIYTKGKISIGTISAGNGGVDSVVVYNALDAELKIVGTTGTGSAVFSASPTFTGLLTGATATFSGTSGDIIASTATTGKAFRGTATTGYGLYTTSTTGTAIYGESTGTGGAALSGTSGNGIGGYFLNNATGFATLYVTNNGSGNLASFSNSAGTKFTINNAGNLGNGTYTYTLPSATGTLALTSALSSYLLLAGGTLTGKLIISGVTGNNLQSNRVGTGPHYQTWYEADGTTRRGYFGYGESATNNFSLMNEQNGSFVIGTNSINALTIASTGAATFSGNVSISKATALLVLNDTSGSAAQIGAFGGNLNLIDNATGTKGLVISLSTGAATFSSSVTSANTTSNTINLTTETGYNYKGYQSYWGIRTGTAFDFNLDVYNSGTQKSALTVLQSGNVGIGTTSPSSKLHVFSANGTTYASTAQLRVDGGGVNNNYAQIIFSDSALSDGKISYYPAAAAADRFFSISARTTESDFIIKGNGNVLIGTATDNGAKFQVAERIRVTSATGGNYAGQFTNTHPSAPFGILVNYTNTINDTSNRFIDCEDNTAQRFQVRSNGGVANYQANDVNLSDERTKKEIAPLESYWNKFKAIEIVKFKYKDQTHDDFNIGVIAQQVEKVAPEFIDTDGWGKDKAGEVPMKSVYASDLHHATIKVLQEAMAKIEILEQKIIQLENN